MRFEWDSKKASSNLKKHRISLDEATSVFRDPLAVIFDDEDHSASEHREIVIGHSLLNRLILVCFTERQQDQVRIFGARKLTSKETKDYEERKTIQKS